MEKLEGKVAVVTGASVGIGAKTVEMLVKNGMIVIGLARRVELIEELADKLKDQPGKVHPMKVDITNDEELVKAFEEIERKFNTIHVLINNAGYFPIHSLLNGSTEVWRKVMDTNVLALCIATREAIRIMKKNTIDGQIININSIAGHQVPKVLMLHIYPASKFAVTAICEQLRMELVNEGSKIRVTSISPGAVRTEQLMMFELKDDFPLLNAEDIADSIKYVLSTPPHVQVVGLSRRSELVEKRSRQLANQPGKLLAMKVDVTNDEELSRTFREIEDKYTNIHLLINNAGIFPKGSLIDGDIQMWRKVVDTNLMALCIATREAVRIMRKNAIEGLIININSVAGHYVPDCPNINMYSASKHGVTAATETMRQELIAAGSKIKLTSVSPGFVWTEGVAAFNFEGVQSADVMQPEDIAEAIIYILSTPQRVNVTEMIIKPVGQRI